MVKNKIDSPTKSAIRISKDKKLTCLEEPDINNTETLYNIISGAMTQSGIIDTLLWHDPL